MVLLLLLLLLLFFAAAAAAVVFKIATREWAGRGGAGDGGVVGVDGQRGRVTELW
jgi:hypothetical protein